MNIQENLEWILAQPLAFWISAIGLAIVANLATSAIRSSYTRTLTLSKSVVVSYYCRLISSLDKYIKSGNIQYVVSTTDTFFIIYAIIVSLLVSISFSDQELVKDYNAELIRDLLVLAVTAISFYGLFRIIFRRLLLIQIFHIFAVTKKYEATDEGYIDFVAEQTKTSRGDVERIFQKRRGRGS